MNAVVVWTQDDLSAAQKRIAAQAIEELHAAYYQKGGLHDAMEKVREKAGGVSTHIYRLAVYAAKQHEDLEQAAEFFGALCAHAEAQYKEAHKVVNLKETLPVWSVFKSSIRGAMLEGLSPLEYRSEHALRDAREAESAGEEPRRLGAPPRGKRDVPAKEIKAFLTGTGISAPLRGLTSTIVVSLEHLRPSKRGEAAVVLREASAQLQKMVDKRRQPSV